MCFTKDIHAFHPGDPGSIPKPLVRHLWKSFDRKPYLKIHIASRKAIAAGLTQKVSSLNAITASISYGSYMATKFCEIFPLLLTVCTAVKSKGKISQSFVAFTECMNFNVILTAW